MKRYRRNNKNYLQTIKHAVGFYFDQQIPEVGFRRAGESTKHAPILTPNYNSFKKFSTSTFDLKSTYLELQLWIH